jgi:hypothetical protein
MNRAWIPAGALAGVSVAGLIAVGQLTDSLGTTANFTPTLAVPTSTQTQSGPVPVSVDLGPTGSTKTSAGAAFNSKGGRQAPAAPTSGESGPVGYKRTASTSNTTAPATLPSTPSVTPTAPSTPAKKPVKRQHSLIGADSGPNGSDGLAGGGSHSSTSTGAQSGTPAP